MCDFIRFYKLLRTTLASLAATKRLTLHTYFVYDLHFNNFNLCKLINALNFAYIKVRFNNYQQIQFTLKLHASKCDFTF